MRYAYQDASGWHAETVDGEGDVGRYTSLELGRDSSVHISYSGDSDGSLKYAFRQGSSPVPKPVYLPMLLKG